MTAVKKQHPQRRKILVRLNRGQSVEHIARVLHVSKKTVAAFRKELGLEPMNLSVSLEDKFDRNTLPPDEHGHVAWIGRRASSGTPVIRMPQGVTPAAHVAFQTRTGRKPVGVVQAECGEMHCLAPGHVADEIERRRVRLQLRYLSGGSEPWDVCAKGTHAWDEFGRVGPDLGLYCAGCNTERVRVRRTRAEGQASS